MEGKNERKDFAAYSEYLQGLIFLFQTYFIGNRSETHLSIPVISFYQFFTLFKDTVMQIAQ